MSDAWGDESSAESDDRHDSRWKQIAEVWNQWRVCEDSAAASLGTLEELERQVTECLYRGDVDKAESLTTRALLLMLDLDDL